MKNKGNCKTYRNNEEHLITEQALRLQNELAQRLVSATSAGHAMDAILDTIMQLKHVDCAGIYIFDSNRDLLELTAHRKLSPLFIARASRYRAHAPETRLALKGIPFYGTCSDGAGATNKTLADEGIRSFADIPIMNEGKLSAVIKLASKTCECTPSWTRQILETLALQTGASLMRIFTTEKLIQNETMLRNITDNVPSIVYISRMTENGEMVFDFVSRAAKTITGYSAEELVANCSLAWNLVVPEDVEAFQASILESVRSKTPWSHSFRIRTPDGDLKWILSSSVPQKPAGPKDVVNWVGTLTDITERKKTQEAGQKTQAQMIHGQKMELIGSLSAGMAHEINTPIQFIGNNIEFIKDSFKNILKHLDTVKMVTQTSQPDETVESLKKTLAESVAGLDTDYLRKEIPEALKESLEGVAAVAKIVKAMKEFAHGGNEDLRMCDINKCVEN